MFHNRRASGAILLAISLLLGACGTKAPASPTPDANAIFTAAAETIAVGLTETAALIPTETITPLPTATETQAIPTLPAAPATGGNAASGGNATSQSGAAAPTAVFQQSTPGPAATKPVAAVAAGGVTTGDKAQWVSNKPADGVELGSGVKFDLVWTVTNIGTTTWTTGYSARYFYGTKIGENTVVNFPKEVKPGESVSIVIDAVAPTANGEYQTWWKLTNADGQNFGDVDFTFHIGRLTSTYTPTP